MTSAVEPHVTAVLDPDRRIVDAHHHLFVRPQRRYLADDYRADLGAGHRIIASVYVEAGAFRRTTGPEWLRPLGEVEFANGVGAMANGGYFDGRLPCAGIVGHADLRLGDDLDRLLDRMQAAAPERFRGIRQLALDHPCDAPFAHMAVRPPRGLLGDRAFRDGLACLSRRGLTFDLAVYHEQFGDCAALADAFPAQIFVLNHLGMIYAHGTDAAARTDLRREWAAGLADLAWRPNVTCKIGGLGMPIWGLEPDEPGDVGLARAWSPYVETAISAFGPDRCMMESNFPIDAVAGDYRSVWNALKRTVSAYSEDEKDALFSGTAATIYRLRLS